MTFYSQINRFCITNLFLLPTGVTLVAAALELFLIPNKIIDGGVVGISILLSSILKQPLGWFILGLNIPFMALGYKKLGKSFILNSFYCIILLATLVNFFHDKKSITDDPLLACVFGGIVLGVGLGIILRNNGSLDGTEIIALLLNKKLPFSIGEIIMFCNIIIFSSAGFVFGWDRAMYSVLTYLIIFKTVDFILEGLDESKSMMIISDKYEEIAQGIISKFERGVTYIEGQGAYTGEKKKIVFCVISRLQLASLKNFILDVDPAAFIAIENVHEVEGGLVKKQRVSP